MSPQEKIALANEMRQADSIAGMFMIIDKHYAIEAPIGAIAKGLIINQLASKYENKLNGKKNQLIDELKYQPNLKSMIAVVDKYVDFSQTIPTDHEKISTANALANNFESITTVARIKKR